jgi:ATP-dependent DNA helicase RecQ
LLVVRTALTYLELLGVVRQGTPFYAGYRLRPALEPEEIVARFTGEPAAFLRELFRRAKKGRVWLGIDPEALSAAMDQPRARIVRSLEVLEERGYAELQASDVRHRFTRITPCPLGIDDLVSEIHARFARREAQEIARLHQVLELVHLDGCKTNALVAHFGELRHQPCGHCSGCTSPVPIERMPAAPRVLPAGLDHDAILAVVRAHPAALGDPRQLARFLCGLPSPAVSRARLGRHTLFGLLAEHRFAQVLELAGRLLAS